MKVSMTHISWSTDFALYLEDYLMYEHHTALVDTLPDVRYWSEVLCCTIITHVSDLEIKVTDFEILL